MRLTFHFGEFGGGAEIGGVAARFQKGGGLFHAGSRLEIFKLRFAAGAAVDIDGFESLVFCRFGLDGVSAGDFENVGEPGSFGDQRLDFGVAGMAELDPLEASLAVVGRVFLNPFGGIERARREVVFFVGHVQGADHVIAIVAHVDGLAVAHHVA